MTKMSRITTTTSTTLDDLQKSTGKTKQKLIEIAVEKLYNEYFVYKANKAYAKLKKNKKAWQEELKEREIWNQTLIDGLENE